MLHDVYVEGIGTYVLSKFDQQLFKRYTRNSSDDSITEGQFADDVVLLQCSCYMHSII